MPQYPAILELSDLDGDNGFRIDGSYSWGSGHAVASAGDVNGDGFADVIVGAYNVYVNGPRSGAGFVVFGKASGFAAATGLTGLDGTSGFRLSGAAAFDDTGWSVASAGDVNGDGYADLILGADEANANGANSGASYVVFGKASGFSADVMLSSLNGSDGFRVSGATDNDYTGISVASAGDVNGDGLDDLIIGGVGADPHGQMSGAAYVVFGKANGFGASIDLGGLDGATGFKLSGAAAYDFTGGSVASAGDINGDGFDDLIVGADNADSNGANLGGVSYVVFGKASGFDADIELSSLNGSNGFKISGVTAGDFSGNSVASAGDVNGDGRGDFIIGAPSASNGFNTGASYVVFGRAGGFAASLELSSLDGSDGFRISGAAAQDFSGTSVASAGDVNGDGFDDLIIGAPRADPNGGQSGASYVVFGKASGFAANLDLSSLNGSTGFRIDGAAAGDQSGGSVASAGDVNGDGLDDLIVGATYPNAFSGSSYVLFGRLPDTFVIRTGTAAGQSLVGGEFGDNLSGLGGADSLYGHGGADGLFGGAGNDLLRGGDGNDGLDGGKGNDTASYVDAAAFVSVNVDLVGYQDTHGAGLDQLTSIENLVGSAFGDLLAGGGGRNTLDGGAGDDLLLGFGGTDVLIGGAGIDTASYANAGARVKVSLALKAFQNTLAEGKDKLSGIENLTGSAFDDKLTGDSSANVLDGGAGGDTLSGKSGADVFVFHAPGDSTLAAQDLITDFAAGDLIDLQAIDADTASDGDQAFHLGATPGHAGDVVVTYAHGPNRTTLSLYVDGDATADAAIQLSGDHTGLTAADFVL